MIFAGADWAEAHHDVCVMNSRRPGPGRAAGRATVPPGSASCTRSIAARAGDGEPVVGGIEIDRGLVVTALLVGGLPGLRGQPAGQSRVIGRCTRCRAPSPTAGTRRMLADLARTDRHNQRPWPGTATWLTRSGPGPRAPVRGLVTATAGQRAAVGAAGVLPRLPSKRSALTWPATDAIAVLTIAPTPELGRALSRAKIAAALRRGGRQRNIDRRARGDPGPAAAELPAGPARGHRRLRGSSARSAAPR